jgi:hypothetical protein
MAAMVAPRKASRDKRRPGWGGEGAFSMYVSRV